MTAIVIPMSRYISNSEFIAAAKRRFGNPHLMVPRPGAPETATLIALCQVVMLYASAHEDGLIQEGLKRMAEIENGLPDVDRRRMSDFVEALDREFSNLRSRSSNQD